MRRYSLISLMLFALAAIGLTSCNEGPFAGEADLLIEKSAQLQTLSYADELTDPEKEGILLMREEEKMARDLYLNFNALWESPIFKNIAQSEQNHYDAVYTLIDHYQLTDPSTAIPGTFNHPAISDLYEQLNVQGSVSLIEALKVGAYVEEFDIIDLEKLIEASDNPAIQQIYGNLLRGSRNHLRAFTSLLATYGAEYQPQLMEQEAYELIIASPAETGNGKQNQNGKGFRGGR